MPLYDVGYRHWKGRLGTPWLRWWPIARTGIALSRKARALRLLLLVSWAPVVFFGFVFFIVGNVAANKDAYSDIVRPFSRMLGRGFVEQFVRDPSGLYGAAWALIFDQFLLCQTLFVGIVLTFVGPPLLALDVRSKAFLLYFSRPITRWEYLLGKAGVVFFHVAMVTLVPGLVLYAASLGFSPTAAALAQTWRIPLQLGVCFLAIAVPCTALILFLSSLSSDHRLAGFGWIALWIVGGISHKALAMAPRLQGKAWPALLSPWENLYGVCQRVFNIHGLLGGLSDRGILSRHWIEDLAGARPIAPSLALLGLLSIGCFLGIARRISAPLRQ